MGPTPQLWSRITGQSKARAPLRFSVARDAHVGHDQADRGDPYVIDDYIRAAIAQGVNTVPNIGAGLDRRPYRMDIPESLFWIEADYRHVIAFKERQLSSEKPRCQLKRVPLDLAHGPERWKLLASVNERATKLLVLAEGVISCLSVEEVGSLANDLRTIAHAHYRIVE